MTRPESKRYAQEVVAVSTLNDRCERCDRPKATQAMWDNHADCECALCVAACWDSCNCEPCDWRGEALAWRTFAAHLAQQLHGWDKSFPVPSEPDEQASYRGSLLARADVMSTEHARMRRALERLRRGPWTPDDVREIAREALRG